MDERVCVYVGIGSNLEDSFQHVSAAVQELGAVAHAGQVHRSALYRSAPMGPAEQPDYLNAAVRFETVLAPLVLLDALQAIERNHGRVRGERWGARTLDLDLLLYGSRVIEHPRLRVPHPGLADRLFVVRPLEDLDPGVTVPRLGTVGDIARTCPTWDMERVPWPAVGA